jgi:uncharacterized protein DUF4157/L,D-transpeptidase-like protein
MHMARQSISGSADWTPRPSSRPWSRARPDVAPRDLRAPRALPGSRVPADSASGLPAVQRQGVRRGGLRASVGGDVERVVSAPGQGLDPVVRRFMEARFAQDFGDVRVHRGADAQASAGDLHAMAYTTGSHIVFAPGAYQPQAPEGRRLLAHELSHVVQQRRGPVTGEPVGGLRVSRDDDSFERAADADAGAALSAAPVAVQRQEVASAVADDSAGPADGGGLDCSCSQDDVLAYQGGTGTDQGGGAASPPPAVQAFPANSDRLAAGYVQRQPDPAAGPVPTDAGAAPAPDGGVAPDAGSAPKSLPKPCSPDAKACFSVGKQQAWLKLASGEVISVPALGGRKGHRTPLGKKFKVISKDKDHKSSLYNNAPMPFYVHFAPAVGFHAGSLSTPSHGCVHLSASDAERFFNNLDVGDRVDVIE